MFTRIQRIYWLIIMLTHRDCMAETGNIYFAKTDTMINLNDYVTCSKPWISFNKPSTSDFSLTMETTRFYYCGSPDKLIFIFPIDKNLEVVTQPPNLNSAIIGDKVNLSCSVTFWANSDKISTKLQIYDSFKTLNTSNDEASLKKYEGNLVTNGTLESNGSKTFYCSWTYASVQGNIKLEDVAIANVTIRVYMRTRNVQPDRTVAKANATITCTSEADPPSDIYSWNCQDNACISDRHLLRCLKVGIYNCSCEAENTINDNPYKSSWNGSIEILTEEEFKQKYETLKSGAVAGIVIGILLLVLLVVIVAVVVYMKHFKSRVTKVKGMSKQESLEVVDNHLYGHFKNNDQPKL